MSNATAGSEVHGRICKPKQRFYGVGSSSGLYRDRSVAGRMGRCSDTNVERFSMYGNECAPSAASRSGVTRMKVRNCLLWLVPGLLPAVAAQACAVGEALDDETLYAVSTGAFTQVLTATGTFPAPVPTGTDPFGTGTVPGATGFPTGSATLPAGTDTTVATAMPTVPASGMPTVAPAAMAMPTGTAPAFPAAPIGAGGAPNPFAPAPNAAPSLPDFDLEEFDVDQADSAIQAMLDLTDISVRYQTTNTSKDIAFDIALHSNTDAEIALDELTVRYWYSSDDAPMVEYVIDGVGDALETTANVTAAHVRDELGREYIEFSFASGNLSVGSDVGVQFRTVPADDTEHDQSGDYSFDADARITEDYEQVTAYRRGYLVWGTEPAAR